jgi:hypothetical protein
MRFQPRLGRILAAASENFVSIIDVENQVCRLKLQVGCRLSYAFFFLPGFICPNFKSAKTIFCCRTVFSCLLCISVSLARGSI